MSTATKTSRKFRETTSYDATYNLEDGGHIFIKVSRKGTRDDGPDSRLWDLIDEVAASEVEHFNNETAKIGGDNSRQIGRAFIDGYSLSKDGHDYEVDFYISLCTPGQYNGFGYASIRRMKAALSA